MKRIGTFLFAVCVACLALAQSDVRVHDSMGTPIGLSSNQMLGLVLGAEAIPGIRLKDGVNTYIELNSSPYHDVPAYSSISRVWDGPAGSEMDMVRIEIRVFLSEAIAKKQLELMRQRSAAMFSKTDAKSLGYDLAFRSVQPNCGILMAAKGRMTISINVLGDGDQTKRVNKLSIRQSKLLR